MRKKSYFILKNSKGFTLLELIIVIVIVGVLSIIAVPVYKNYIEKTRPAPVNVAATDAAGDKISLEKT
jgi:prepilin-type N-terminal cleavage/methylation domain-containing protein